MTAPPIPCIFTGGTFVPVRPRDHETACQHYGEGEIVNVVAQEDRSDISHRHEFAWLREAWKTLPEHIADEFPSADHLRKWALIKGGFHDEQRIDVGSNAGAIRVAQAIRAMPGEGFSAIVVRGPLVVIRRAKSQARGKMDRAEFAASKQAIIEAVSELLEVTPQMLKRSAAA